MNQQLRDFVFRLEQEGVETAKVKIAAAHEKALKTKHLGIVPPPDPHKIHQVRAELGNSSSFDGPKIDKLKELLKRRHTFKVEKTALNKSCTEAREAMCREATSAIHAVYRTHCGELKKLLEGYEVAPETMPPTVLREAKQLVHRAYGVEGLRRHSIMSAPKNHRGERALFPPIFEFINDRKLRFSVRKVVMRLP